MEKVDRFASHGILDESLFNQELSTVFDSLEMTNIKERSRYTSAIREHVSTFLKSPVTQEIRSGIHTRTEFAVQTLLPSCDTLYGIIDRLFQDTNGTWTILDYKTEANPNSKNRDRYRFQLHFYAYLVHLMYPSSETIRCILFFTANGEIVEFLFTRSDFLQFSNECAAALIEQIRMQENIPNLTLLPRNTDHCPECRFFDQAANECIVVTTNPQNPTAIPAI